MELEDPFIAKQAEKSARWTTTHRVNGELAVSRGIGDPDYKGTDICGLIHEILLLIEIIDRCVCLQAKGCRSTFGPIRKVTPKKFTADLVLAIPDIKVCFAGLVV